MTGLLKITTMGYEVEPSETKPLYPQIGIHLRQTTAIKKWLRNYCVVQLREISPPTHAVC